MSNGKLVLIVEDCQDIAALEADIVMESGALAVVVSEGEVALAALRETQFALILLDLALPGLAGSAILEAMAADSALCQIPVVVLSAGIDNFKPTRQVVAVYSKPFSPDKLIDTIQRFLATNGSPATFQVPRL